MTLRAVLFDVGDTLLHEQPARFEIYAEVARGRGRAVDAPDMRRLMVRTHHALSEELDGAFRYSDPWFEEFIRQIFVRELGLPEGDFAGIARELFERFEDPATFRVFPGARELLAELRERGVRLGVVSNWSARLPRMLRALELLDAFDFVLSSAIEQLEKPDPALFERARDLAGVDASAILHTGDSIEKDGAAREVGIDFVLLDHFDRSPTFAPRAGDFAALRRHLLPRLP